MVRLEGGARAPETDVTRAMGAGARRRAVLGLLASALGLSLSPATALEGGSGPDDPEPGAPWSGVGSLFAGGRLLSGVLVDPHWVLTAAHAVSGAVPAEVVFRSPLGKGFVSRARSVHLHPAFHSARVDLALVRLADPAPRELVPARLYGGPLLGAVARLVSHGGSTTLLTRGENRIDAVLPDASGQPRTYLFDFDGPDLASNRIGPSVPALGTLGARREATLVAGDSGSAAFVVIEGQWWLAGINTFQATVGAAGQAHTGRVAGGVVLAPQADWIAQTLRDPAPVEPLARP